MVNRRFVLLKFQIRKERVVSTAREFLGRYPDTIRFAPHGRSLAAEALLDKIVTEEEDAIAIGSHKLSGDPSHFHNSILHSCRF